MGRFINYDNGRDLIDDKEEPRFINDPFSNTLILDKEKITEEIPVKKPKTSKPKKNNKKINIKKPDINITKIIPNKTIFVIPVILILLVLFIICIIKINVSTKDVLNTDAFFLMNNENKFALFNESGKKLTDFNFKMVSNFVNNSALVYNDDYLPGVINHKGRMVIKFGKYQYIYNEGPMYYLTDNDSEYILVTASGKKVYKEVGFEVVSFGNEYALIKNEDQFILFNYNGKKLLTFKDEHIEQSPSISEKDGILAIYYNHEVIMVNIKKQHKMATFNSKTRFCITDVSKNGLVLLNACDLSGDILLPNNYLLIKNKKIKFDIIYNNQVTPSFYGEYVLLQNGEQLLLINNAGEEVKDIKDGSFNNYKNYVALNEDGYLNIYYHNKLRVATDCKKVINKYAKDGVYLMSECSNNKYRYYTLKGGEIGSEYDEAHEFINGVAIIKDENSYYLVNNNFKKLSKGYQSLVYTNIDDYYIASTGDKEIILDKKGSEIVSGLRVSIFETKTNFGYIAKVDGNNAFIVYNLTRNEEITSLIDEPVLQEHYFIVAKSSAINYYSYKTGKIFYAK